MTISSTTREAGPYAGNDVTTVFPFAFKVFAAADLLVAETDDEGVQTVLTLTTDYSVSLNADQNAAPGGNVTRVGALPTGYEMLITSDLAALQPTNLTNAGGFYPRVINDALDRLTILVQQALTGLSRAIQLPYGETNTVLDGGEGFVAIGPSGPYIAAGAIGVPATAFGASLVDDASAAAARVTLTTDGVNDLWMQSRGPYGGGISVTAPLAAALAVTPLGRETTFRAGYQYRMDTGLSVDGPINLVGEGKGAGPGAVSNAYCSQLLANFAAGDVLYVGPSLYGSRFEHFQINSNVGQRTSGAGIHIDATGLGSTNYQHLINDVAFSNQYISIRTTNCGVGTIENTYHQAWKRTAIYQEGDGVHEGASGFIQNNVFFGDTASGTAQQSALEIHNGYSRTSSNSILGGQFGQKFVVDAYDAGAHEFCGNWTEEQDVAGFYALNSGGHAASMLAVNWGEYSIATFAAATRANFQGSVVLAAGAGPWLTTSQIIGNRIRNNCAAGAAAFINAQTGSRLQISQNNLEGLGGNTTAGIVVGAQAAQVSVLDNLIYGNFSNKYLLTSEVMFRDFESRLVVTELPTCRDGSLAWCENAIPHSNPVTAGGVGAVVVRRGGIWCALDSADEPTVIATDAAFTIANGVTVLRHTGTLTADRLVTLPVGAREFRITRTGGGAFNLSIGGLKNLATNTWCVIRRDAGGLYLAEYGAL